MDKVIIASLQARTNSIIPITATPQWAPLHRKSPASRLFAQPLSGRTQKETSKLRVTGLCEGNPRWPVEFSHKGPVTPKMCPFDGVMILGYELPPCVYLYTQQIGCGLHHGIPQGHLNSSLAKTEDYWMNPPYIISGWFSWNTVYAAQLRAK